MQPHMTLDLNFEEKGQQNDIPIDFKVENPWSAGDKLLMNGQQSSVTVVPSPNKDDIRLVTITAACEYLNSLICCLLLGREVVPSIFFFVVVVVVVLFCL